MPVSLRVHFKYCGIVIGDERVLHPTRRLPGSLLLPGLTHERPR